MRSRLSLAAARRCGLAKLFATILVLLAVSPLTAPFSTFDAAEILGETSVHADAGAAKLAQDVIDLASIVAQVSPALTEVNGHRMRRVGRPAVAPVSPVVLRI